MRHGLRRAAALLLALAMALSLCAVTTLADDSQADSAPLGIISAMDVELAALVDAAQVEREDTIAGNTFYVGTLSGVDVVLVKAGIGKVLAASCAETLIDTYQVGGIVFTGIAGGVGDDVDVMDMVIGTALVQHDYGTETNDGFVWNGEAAADQETGMIPVDETLSAIAYNAARDVLGADKVHQGVIATGDQFVASETYVKVLQDQFDALACEMEGGSVARVCDQFGVPCAVLRCMSDKADGLAHDTYAFNYTEASNTSASVVMELLETLSTDLPFTDVAKTSWYFTAVAEAYEGGIMSGTSADTFSPGGAATRATGDHGAKSTCPPWQKSTRSPGVGETAGNSVTSVEMSCIIKRLSRGVQKTSRKARRRGAHQRLPLRKRKRLRPAGGVNPRRRRIKTAERLRRPAQHHPQLLAPLGEDLFGERAKQRLALGIQRRARMALHRHHRARHLRRHRPEGQPGPHPRLLG